MASGSVGGADVDGVADVISGMLRGGRWPEIFGDLCSAKGIFSCGMIFAGDLNLNAMMMISKPAINPNILSQAGGKWRNKNTITQIPRIISNCLFDMWLV